MIKRFFKLFNDCSCLEQSLNIKFRWITAKKDFLKMDNFIGVSKEFILSVILKEYAMARMKYLFSLLEFFKHQYKNSFLA